MDAKAKLRQAQESQLIIWQQQPRKSDEIRCVTSIIEDFPD